MNANEKAMKRGSNKRFNNLKKPHSHAFIADVVRSTDMKFRKKAVVIEATEWDGTNESWQHIMNMGLTKWKPGEMGTQTFYIETLEGDHLARKGDWIIKGVHGEFYPCKPDIFVKTYEPAE